MGTDVRVYNVGPEGDMGRHLGALVPELNAIFSTDPDITVLIETIGWGPLPNYAHYVKYRDRTTEGRANITTYVHKRLGALANRGRWIACDLTWRQTRAGASPRDRHPAREFFKLSLPKITILASHDPPLTKWKDTGPARAEHLHKVSHELAPWLRDTWDDRTRDEQRNAKDRLRVNLGDPNGQGDDLAKLVGGSYEGTNIEGGTVVGGHWKNARTQTQIGGVRMKSDHKRLFIGTLVDD